MLLLALLPAIFAWLVFVLFYYNEHNGVFTRIRIAALYSGLLTCLYCAVSTEVLNIITSINFNSILAVWAVPVLLMAGYALRKKTLFPVTRTAAGSFTKLLVKNPVLSVICLLLLVLAVLAFVYPPNNYDSMTYHMARVAHWEQNQSISHYQTHILRQLIYPPFAEWVILHLQVLTGMDRLANCVQLFFFVGCIMNISLITKELGGSFGQQMLSIIFCFFIPMALLQSNTTQNDIVVSYFVTAFMYLVIHFVKFPTTRNMIMCGVSLGLAWLTKGSAFIFTLPICLWVFIVLVKNIHLPLKKLIKKAVLISLIPLTAVALNSPQFYRNSFLNDDALGMAGEGTANERYSLKPILIVSIKNIMNHLPANKWMKYKVTKLSAAWNIDVNDPEFNFNTLDHMMEGLSYHEDYAQNFPHIILIIFLAFWLLFQKKFLESRINYYTLIIFTLYGMAALYCILLKWQPWSNRLQTPLFMLFAVPLAMETSRLQKMWQYLVCAPVVYYGLVVMFSNAQHPVFPLKESILHQPYENFIFKKGMLQCRDYINTTSHKKLGIYIGADSWDYPYYKLLGENDKGRRSIKHVFVNNESTIYLDNFIPDAIISGETGREKYSLRGHEYVRSKVFEGMAIFEQTTATAGQ